MDCMRKEIVNFSEDFFMKRTSQALTFLWVIINFSKTLF